MKQKIVLFFRGFGNILFHGKAKDKVIAWLLIALYFFVLLQIGLAVGEKISVVNIETSVLVQELQNDNIEKISISKDDGTASGTFRNEKDGYKYFTTTTLAASDVFNQEILNALEKNKESPIQFDYYKPSTFFSSLYSTLVSVFVFLLMLCFMFYLMSKTGSMGDLKSIFDDTHKISTSIPNTSFKDVLGCPEALEETSEIVTFLKNPVNYKKANATPPKGILLHGSPGTGKTLLARALAGESGVPFIYTSGSNFIEMYAGLGAKRVRKAFETARNLQPSILFIDEIDAIGGSRDTMGSSSENLQTINTLLNEMDGFEKDSQVIVVAATNRVDSLDKALVRPGRFDKIVNVDTPNKEGRKEILEHYAQGKPFDKRVDFEKLAQYTYGFSGAQLEGVMNQAATLAARRATEQSSFPKITKEDLDEGISRVIAGPAMKSKQMSEIEKKQTAYHEAGHAVVQYVLPDCDEVQKISIVNRNIPGVGTALGYVQSYSEKDAYVTTLDKCNAEIAALLGGRCSEKIFCKIESAGASNDLEKASNLAYRMVDEFAFSVGNKTLKVSVRDINTNMLKVGNERSNYIDQQVEGILQRQYKVAEKIINQNKDKIEKMVSLLLEQEVINSDEIKKIFEEK